MCVCVCLPQPVEAPPPSLSDGLTSLRLQLQPLGRTHLQCRWIGAVLFRLRDVYSYFTRHEKPVRGPAGHVTRGLTLSGRIEKVSTRSAWSILFKTLQAPGLGININILISTLWIWRFVLWGTSLRAAQHDTIRPDEEESVVGFPFLWSM